MTVNFVFAGDFRNEFLSLTEAMLLAEGDLHTNVLHEGECNQVSTTVWLSGTCIKLFPSNGPGAGTADTIGFDETVFAPGIIQLGPQLTLPEMEAGNDTIDGSGADVRLNGGGANCFEIESNGNTIKGLQLNFCGVGILAPITTFGNTIGGFGPNDGNVISGNAGDGITFVGGGNNSVIGNRIGTNAAGNQAFPNGDDGIFFIDSGGLIEDNLVSGNTGVGILAVNSSLVLRGNMVGTDADGNEAIPNTQGLVFAQGSTGKIGGTNEFDRNIFSGNLEEGIQVSGSSFLEVLGNYIGTTADGGDPLPNGTGVRVRGTTNQNKIGGTDVGERNIIAYNTGDGVLVDSFSGTTTGNAIRGNSIHSNGGKGIELVNGGNNEIPPPVITGFGSVFGTTCPLCTVDIYSDNSDEGHIYEGWRTAGFDGSWSFQGSLTGPNVTVTVTDPLFNTSEFSDPVSLPPPVTPTPSLTVTVTPTPAPSFTPTLSPTTTPSDTATATSTPGAFVWGDVDCSGTINPVDSLKTLRYDAGLSVEQANDCPPIGEPFSFDGAQELWGDVDCSGAVTPVDSLKGLRFDAGLTVFQEDGCPPIGSSVESGAQ
ncbi:MAG TPA: right-handed parallel beta-helix repeat-containing protein [Dehalococcoidia bacterium]|nr:right-handed parallel beta-helix repeat-containing protein [Dehalococcoidia bacterium]